MAQAVWGRGNSKACLAHVAGHDPLDRARAQPESCPARAAIGPAPGPDEEGTGAVASLVEVTLKPDRGSLGEEDHPRLAALADDAEFATQEVDRVAVERRQLGDAKPGAEEGFQEGSVSQPAGVGDVGSCHQPGKLGRV